MTFCALLCNTSDKLRSFVYSCLGSIAGLGAPYQDVIQIKNVLGLNCEHVPNDFS